MHWVIYWCSLEPHRNRNKRYNKKKRNPRKAWYDQTCYEANKKLKNVAQLLTKSPTNPYLRGSFVKTRKEYKKLLKIKSKEWKQAMIHRLESIEEKDPKEYWKLINELREKKKMIPI